MFNRSLVVNANDVDSGQMLHSMALDLHCVQISLLWDARHKWVKKEDLMFTP